MDFKYNATLEDFKEFLDGLIPYNSIQEKRALIQQADGEKNPIKIVKVLGEDSKNRFEAIAIIFKKRENSVSDLIEYNHKCPSCDYLDIASVSITDMFFKGEVDETVPIGLFEDLEEILSEEVINNLSIVDYNELEQKIFKNNLSLFDPALTTRCKKCGMEDKTVFDLSSVISKTTLKNLYEQYLDITYYTSMTKTDVDGMLPFEREVFLGLIQKKEDEKAKPPQQ